MDCHIVGDSIAVSVSQEMRECTVSAVVDLSAAGAIDRVRPATFLIVSAGSNNPRDPALKSHLEALRSRATGRVIWILPRDHVAAATVRNVALFYRDVVVAFESNIDGVHPRHPRTLANEVRRSMK